MNDRSSLSALLSRARRRRAAHLIAEQSTLALAISMGGAILLLLLGTQILDWYWVALLAVTSLGAALYRVRKKIPPTYTIAQWIDRRLHLADTLSTASYFSSADIRGDDQIRRQQRQQAETAARSVDLKLGIPFVRPRYMYPALLLAAVAFGMFALRYAVTGSLSLRPSLARIAFDTFFPPKPEQAKANRKRPDRSKIDPNSPDDPQEQADAMLDAMDKTDPMNPEASQRTEESKNGERSADANGAAKTDESQQDDAKNGDPQQGKQDSKEGANSSENANLMDKLRDAMSNMMSKMTSSGQKSARQQNKSSGKSDKSNADAKNSQNSNQNAEGESEGAQEQGQSQADASSSDQGTDKMDSPDGKSGIGSTDGEKRARDAEQLQAMGKISEILGKRAAGVSGEVMVEVGSSKQQLKTAWSQTQATHQEAGGEIHRDEVPLMYQQFVEQYFEQIRKPGAKPAAKDAGQ